MVRIAPLKVGVARDAEPEGTPGTGAEPLVRDRKGAPRGGFQSERAISGFGSALQAPTAP